MWKQMQHSNNIISPRLVSKAALVVCGWEKLIQVLVCFRQETAKKQIPLLCYDLGPSPGADLLPLGHILQFPGDVWYIYVFFFKVYFLVRIFSMLSFPLQSLFLSCVCTRQDLFSLIVLSLLFWLFCPFSLFILHAAECYCFASPSFYHPLFISVHQY